MIHRSWILNEIEIPDTSSMLIVTGRWEIGSSASSSLQTSSGSSESSFKILLESFRGRLAIDTHWNNK